MRTWVCILTMCLATLARAVEPPELIPRHVLFGNPDRARGQLSPDGTMVSYLAAASGSQVLNVWVAPAAKLADAKLVTSDPNRGISRYWWTADSKYIVYMQDRDGDENWHIYAVPAAGGSPKDLTPFDEIPGPDGKPLVDRAGRPMRPAARLVSISDSDPSRILVSLNIRDPRLHDLYSVELISGACTPVRQAPDNTVEWVVDNALQPRFAITFADDGGQVWLKPSAGGGWDASLTFSSEDALTSGAVGFNADNNGLYLQDSRARNTSALFEVKLDSGEAKLLAQDQTADLADVLVHPASKRVQAASFNRLRADWVVLDESIREDFKALGTLKGEIQVVSRSRDDRTWLVLMHDDDGPNNYYLYRRAESGPGKTEFLFCDRPALARLPLVPMRPLVIRSRDGLEMVSYLSLPRDAAPEGKIKPSSPLPMVLLVHGGPWARDEWGYNSLHQLLANRGYAVLSVNYRGSTGFGKSFLNAAAREWAGKMHDDLIDAVNWAVKEGIADRSRVAIMGGSYGGYAALVGLTFTPDVFACGVDIVGPSNLVTLLESIPEYWKPGMAMWRARVGDVSTEEGRAFLKSRSPLTFVDRIAKPLLIGHGANDPRVKIEESDQIVAAMMSKHIPVAYAVFPDEGHGFMRPRNKIAFFGLTEAFLSKHLGGRCEPLGDIVAGSTAEIRAGRDLLGPAER